MADNFLSNIIRAYRNIFGNYVILDSLVLRPGIYNVLLILIGYYLWITHNRKMLMIFLPYLGNTLTWVILMSHQSFRYVWYIQLLSMFILLSVLTFPPRGQKEKEITIQ